MLLCLFIQSHGLGSHKHSAYTEVSAECVLAVLSRAGGVGKGQNSQANRGPGYSASYSPSTKVMVEDTVAARPDPLTWPEFHASGFALNNIPLFQKTVLS